MRARGLSLRAVTASLLAGAALLSVAPARAAEPKVTVDPAVYNDPSYDPAAHSGLPYAVYLRLSRGTFRRSTGMMATGIVLVGLGSTVMVSGTAVYASHGDCFFGVNGPEQCATHQNHTIGMALLLTGAVATAFGIPLWIVGQSEVPWMEAGKNDRAPVRAARLVPAIVPAAAGQGLAIRFNF